MVYKIFFLHFPPVFEHPKNDQWQETLLSTMLSLYCYISCDIEPIKTQYKTTFN